MNETVTLSQIIARLAKITGTSPLTARSFLKVFFATIEKELIAGETVTVKGIGTFRRTDDPLAPSPVAFIPDPEVAEEINQPFAMFEAVELDDDISEDELSAVEAPAAVEESAPEVQMQEEIAEEKSEEPIEIVTAETVEEATPPSIEEEAPAAQPEASVEETVEDLSEDNSELEPSPALESEPSEPEPVIDPVVEPVAEPEPVVETYKAPEEPVAPKTYVAPKAYYEEEEKSPSMPFYVWILLGFAVGLALGYFLGFSIGSRQRAVSSDMDILTTIVFPDTIASETALAPVVADEPAPAVEQEPVAEVPAEPEKVVEKAPEPEKPVFDTVTRTRYLATMAREHYGAMEYWVFIYKANESSLGNPDKIRPGTKVEIPPFSRYAQGSPSDPANIERARSMSKEIYAKYRRK